MKMKQLLVIIIGALNIAFLANAQENNPFNQVGIDYIASIKIVREDFNNGKFKDLTKEAIEEYSKTLPSKVQMDMEVAGTVVSAVKGKEFNLIKQIMESKLSPTAKKILIEIIKGMSKLDVEDAKTFLATKVNEVKNSDIIKTERELILSYVAIAYHSYFNPSIYGRDSCVFVDEHGQQHEGAGACILLGIGIGYWIGNAACGTLCGVGGAIIGGIVGAVS